jgi:hypothetical protein
MVRRPGPVFAVALLAGCLLLPLVVAVPALGNDAGLEMPSGGPWRPMKQHPSIRLEKETVSIRLLAKEASIKVVASYLNDGPTCSIRMGFPERAFGWSDPGQFGRSFRSWVDDEPAKVAPSAWSEEEGVAGLRVRWWMKKVSFAKKQRRTVRVEYRFQYGNAQTIEYLLHTGASWRGPIGALLVEIDLASFQPRDVSIIRDERFRLAGRKFIWRAKRLEPTPSDDINIEMSRSSGDDRPPGKSHPGAAD